MDRISLSFGDREKDKDLYFVSEQNSRLFLGKDSDHLMGLPREVRFKLVDRVGYAILVPVSEGDHIFFLKKITPCEEYPSNYAPVGKVENIMTTNRTGYEVLLLDDPILKKYRDKL